MDKRYVKLLNIILTAGLLAAALFPGTDRIMTVEATNMSGLQNEIDKREEALNELYGQISDWEAEQDMILEKIEDLNSEIINTMASIGVKEEEISAKEAEIEDKQGQIVQTAAEYEAARQREEDQRLDMAARTSMLYELGSDSYMSAFSEGKGLGDILNRMDYIEKVYEYSKLKLEGYKESKDQLQAMWNMLEEQKTGLEADRLQLETDRANLQQQRKDLDAMLAQKKQESDNYEAELDKARQQAAVSQKLLQQDRKKLKQMQEEQQRAQNAAQGGGTGGGTGSGTGSGAGSGTGGGTGGGAGASNAANATYADSDYTKIIDNSSGSDLGKKVAKFACQYIGNPYVSGGTSLTNGADCSGFTYRVYNNFAVDLPRTSTEQRSVGKEVSYENAQPGDLICYEGHVAIYIGGGLVVHASNSNPYPRGGIKVNGAQYRTIIAVRRVL